MSWCGMWRAFWAGATRRWCRPARSSRCWARTPGPVSEGAPHPRPDREAAGGAASPRHPLTLRLDLSTALLSGEPGGGERLDALVRDAASVLGQGYPAVVQARTQLALLDPDARTGV